MYIPNFIHEFLFGDLKHVSKCVLDTADSDAVENLVDVFVHMEMPLLVQLPSQRIQELCILNFDYFC
jgi:hypothetical protein